jgi:hypothetical protein
MQGQSKRLFPIGSSSLGKPGKRNGRLPAHQNKKPNIRNAGVAKPGQHALSFGKAGSKIPRNFLTAPDSQVCFIGNFKSTNDIRKDNCECGQMKEKLKETIERVKTGYSENIYQ